MDSDQSLTKYIYDNYLGSGYYCWITLEYKPLGNTKIINNRKKTDTAMVLIQTITSDNKGSNEIFN